MKLGGEWLNFRTFDARWGVECGMWGEVLSEVEVRFEGWFLGGVFSLGG